MNIYCNLLTLSAFHTATGFLVPQGFVSRGHTTAYSSYLDNVGGGKNVPGSPISQPDDDVKRWDELWGTLARVRVQGGALKTWSYPSPDLERVFVELESDGPPEGNPLRAQIELNQGPDNTPWRMDIYSGKGRLRPCKFWVETPGETNAVFIRNIGPIEFPFNAGVGTELEEDGSDSTMAVSEGIFQMSSDYIVQGGAVRVYDLDHTVSYAKVVLRTDGRPLNASVELIQGPNAPKYTIDVYTEDGDLRPFVFIMKTPGAGNSVRIVNTGTQEFPLTAAMGPTTM